MTYFAIDGDRIGFFFGAGTSIEFGIPSMRQITLTFDEKINRINAPKKQKTVFNTVYRSLVKIYGKENVDLEAIMTVIVGLREKEHLKENIGEKLGNNKLKILSDKIFSFKAGDIAVLLNPDSKGIRIVGSGKIIL